MKTLLTLFVLLFSSSVVAELPSSLFGVELNEEVSKYKYEGVTISEDKYLCNKQEIPDQKVSGEFEGFTDELIEIKLMKNHPLFDSQCISFNNQQSLIERISGSTSWFFYNDLDQGNINRYGLEEHVENHYKIIDTLSNLYEIKDSNFSDFYSFAQTEITTDSGTKFSPQTLILYHFLDFKINGQKTKLYLYSTLMKIKDPLVSRNNLNHFIGSGMLSIVLINEQDESYSEMEKFIANMKENQISKKDIPKYIKLMTSSSSSF